MGRDEINAFRLKTGLGRTIQCLELFLRAHGRVEKGLGALQQPPHYLYELRARPCLRRGRRMPAIDNEENERDVGV